MTWRRLPSPCSRTRTKREAVVAVAEEAVAEGTRKVKYLDDLPIMGSQWRLGMPVSSVVRWDTGVQIARRLTVVRRHLETD